jgi:hypothetical protein
MRNEVRLKMQNHVHSKRHEAIYAQLEQMQKRHIYQVMDQFMNQRLNLPKWKRTIKKLVTKCLESPTPSPAYIPSGRDPFYIKTIKEKLWVKVESRLAIYMQKERMTLLELAMIKHARTTAAFHYTQPDLTVDNVTDQATDDHNRKNMADELKQVAFVKSGNPDIFRLIVQFLGRPPRLVVDLRYK